MVIYMDQYRKARALKTVATAHYYDEEKLCVNGNPAVKVIAMPIAQNPNELSPQLPEDFAKVDVEIFQDRICALASQI